MPRLKIGKRLVMGKLEKLVDSLNREKHRL
jgi:hypothetical protein